MQTTYIKLFADYDEAFSLMRQKNISLKKAGNKADLYCVVPGPNDDYAVVDFDTAVELGSGYVWAASAPGWVNNPWKA